MRGFSIRSLKSGAPVLRIHYSADPDRGIGWAESERKKYTSIAIWQREQEIDYGAGGGELLLAHLLQTRWDDIIISDPTPTPVEYKFMGGFDWGQKNPACLLDMSVDFDGNYIVEAEVYQSGLTPREHLPLWSKLPHYHIIRSGPIYADPNIFYKTQAQADKTFRSIHELMGRGAPVMAGGVQGDITCINRLLEWWKEPVPRLRIRMPRLSNGHYKYAWHKKQEGVYVDGCPNLIWELMHIRRKKDSTFSLQTSSPTEQIVDKDNHAFDALKYVINSRTGAAKEDREKNWAEKVKTIRAQAAAVGDDVDINHLMQMRKYWEKQQKGNDSGVVKWKTGRRQVGSQRAPKSNRGGMR